MPWQGGIYERTNGQYGGTTVWQTDRDNLIKIEAVRHDTHDQDLAAGISACLNINGQNAMAEVLPDKRRWLPLSIRQSSATSWNERQRPPASPAAS